MKIRVGVMLCWLAVWGCVFTGSAWATDDAFSRYATAYEQFKQARDAAAAGTSQGKAASAVNFTGSWSSNSQYIATAKVVDDNGSLKGIVKVPNGSSYDLYHFSGFYYNGTIYLGHFSTSGRQLFIGTSSGTTVTGDLTLYDTSNAFLGRLTGIVLTQDIAQGSLVSSVSLSGNWGATAQSVKAQGTMAATTVSSVGETVSSLTGVANVFYTATAAPYHFLGYMRNNGEVFLYNTNGTDARTLLGTYADGKITGLLEQDAVTVNDGTAASRLVFPLSVIMLMDQQ
ncbi:MAG: hypothetical protein ACP59X_22860 [Solidesulfovibrio sp. DCME]|uniref:hypothetical protein n=1 Tax=Solidesulfovibrio sp. DCME TaxID=3447380 RepID=UPI003D0AF5E1